MRKLLLFNKKYIGLISLLFIIFLISLVYADGGGGGGGMGVPLLVINTPIDNSIVTTDSINLSATFYYNGTCQYNLNQVCPNRKDVPDINLFVMSFCPYGIQAENAMKPVADLLGSKANIKVHFIVNVNGDTPESIQSLHGMNEVWEDLRQVCIQKYYSKNIYWNYLYNFNLNCSNNESLDVCWKNIANSVSINITKISNCANSTEGVNLLKADADLCSAKGISGSPTLLINDITYNGQRTTDAYKKAFCNAFATKPIECEDVEWNSCNNFSIPYSDFSSIETTTIPSGIDSASMATPSNPLTMWNNFASSKQVLTSYPDLPNVLSSGTYTDMTNVSTPYLQYLTFTNAAANGQIVYETPTGGTAPALGLRFSGGNQVYNYLLSFTKQVSEVVSSGIITNMLYTQLNISGRNWTITNATFSGSYGYDLNMIMISGSDKLELEDNDVTDSNYYSGVKINGLIIADASVRIIGSFTTPNSILNLNSIEIRWVPSLEQFIMSGSSLSDHVTGAFKIFFGGITPALDDTINRETITVTPSGTTAGLSFKTFDGYNLNQNLVKSTAAGVGNIILADAGGYAIHLLEGEAAVPNEYVVLGQNTLAGNAQNSFGHIIRVLSFSSSANVTSQLQDVATGNIIQVTGGNTTMYLDGQAYKVCVNGWGAYVHFTWGTSAYDCNVGSAIDVYPTIQTSEGAWIALTNPQNIATAYLYELVGIQPSTTYTLNLPTGSIAVKTGNGTTVGNATGLVTIGNAKYYINTPAAGTSIAISATDNSATVFNTPGMMMIEGLDENTIRNVIAVRLDSDATYNRVDIATVPSFTGTKTTNSGVSGTTQNRYVDQYGTYAVYDSTAPGTLNISYPNSQAKASVYVQTNYMTIKNFSQTINNIPDGNHEINVKCNFDNNEVNRSVFFTIIAKPPIINIKSPLDGSIITKSSDSYFEYGGYKKIWFNITTDKNAICRYNTTDTEYDFDNMHDFGSTFFCAGNIVSFTICHTLNHFAYLPFSGDISDGVYTYYIRCKDEYGNANKESKKVTFIVNTHLTAPIITSVDTNSYQTSTNVILNITTDKDAYCRYSSESVGYDYMSNQFANGESTASHWTNVVAKEGVNIFYASCSDTSGSSMTTATPIIFSVDTSGNYNVTIPLKQWWNSFWLPRIILEKIGSLAGNYTVPNVLSSIKGNYQILYYFNETSWTSYAPGRPPELNDLKEFNDQFNLPYWINMLVADRIEIP